MKKAIDGLEMEAELQRCRRLVEDRLSACFACDASYETLLASMRYSLLSGGKRVRAIICLKFCEASGGDLEKALSAACAIEMLHAYSLIHDDLPCMDDDGMRRGKPSNHIEFGEFTAVLAGDALQAAAFETLMNCGLPSADVVEMGKILAQAAGPHGICEGQYLDLSGEGAPLTQDELVQTHLMKTAALISASAKLGVISAGGTKEQVKAAEEYALALGLAFQIRDDLLDCTSTSEALGKPAGSDSGKGKTTFAALLGADECEAIIRAETKKAAAAIAGKFDNDGFLIWLADNLADRKS